MTTQTDTVDMAAWPEAARQYVKAQAEALDVCGADRAHYVSIVEEHEYDWEMQDELRYSVEALGIENYKLKAECKKLRAQLARQQKSASRSAKAPEPLEGPECAELKDGAIA